MLAMNVINKNEWRVGAVVVDINTLEIGTIVEATVPGGHVGFETYNGFVAVKHVDELMLNCPGLSSTITLGNEKQQPKYAVEEKLNIDQEFSAMVGHLIKSSKLIMETITEDKVALIHCIMGMSGEVGEMLDAIKKHVIYNKPLDVGNILEESGDLLFYFQDLLTKVGLTWEQVKLHNINKLLKGDKARYKNGYSDKAAQERQDKKD